MSEGNGNGHASAKPENHANGASPRSGVVPPIEHRWKQGVSPNPGGLPKGTKKVKTRLRNRLIRRLRAHPEQIDAIVDGLIQGCAEGDAGCQRIAWDRTDGVLEKKVQHTGAVEFNIRGSSD